MFKYSSYIIKITDIRDHLKCYVINSLETDFQQVWSRYPGKAVSSEAANLIHRFYLFPLLSLPQYTHTQYLQKGVVP